jgi:transcription initiation factor IIE alpha subunit
MPVCGDLKTMSLADILQWASMNQKTGVLEVEREDGCQRIELRKGWIGACSADDPSLRIGEFLISRGKLSREELQGALEKQQEESRNLGAILMEMGVLSSTELAQQLAARAEEMIQRMIEWGDAVFRFHDGAVHDPDQVELNLPVSDVLLRGMQRQDELKCIRLVFTSSSIVLQRTDRMVPYELLNKELSKKIFDAIDGERTIAEVLRETGASHFVVIKFLYRLHENGMVSIKEDRGDTAPHATLLDVPPPGSTAPDALWDTPETENRPELELNDPDLQAEVEVARRLMARSESTAAFELLRAAVRAHPDCSFLRPLMAEAAQANSSSLERYEGDSTKVPVVVHSPDEARRLGVSPQELFLLHVLGGKADVRMIRRLASLQEAEVLETLERMVDRGLIQLQEPEPNRPRSAF